MKLFDKYYAIILIFFTSLSALILEILYTRVFAVLYFGHFAFFIVSLALLGYGLSGFYISRKKILHTQDSNIENFINKLVLIFSISIPIVFKIIIELPVNFNNIISQPINLLYLNIVFIAAIIPFFLGGMILITTFGFYSKKINKFYFVDLIGASIGSLVVIQIIPLGPEKIIIGISIIMLIIWYLERRNRKESKKTILFSMLLITLITIMGISNKIFTIKPKIAKRMYIESFEHGKIEYSKWSPINKIDVSKFMKKQKIIWLNGGTQQSFLVKSKKGEYKKKRITTLYQAIPYVLSKKRGSAFIIGSAGGLEVLCALSNKFKKIIAVEMDPVIVELVKGKYSNYIGDIFLDPRVTLFNDEGRSVLKRSNENFDVIQMVNSHTTDLLLSGGLSVSETYIYTVESFKDYWNHLNNGGFLYIVHVFGERLFSTAIQALKELKVENPENKFIIFQKKKGFNFFFMKKGDFSYNEHKFLSNYFGTSNIVFSPFIKKNNVYYSIINGKLQKIIEETGIRLTPVRDNSPYLNQANYIGQFKFKRNIIKGIGKKVVEIGLVYSNYIYFSIFLVSLLFTLAFIVIPAYKDLRYDNKRYVYHLLYFFLIGVGFIMNEIIFIKIFQLFLGNPAYSIPIIIFNLLTSSGMGSYISKNFDNKSITISSLVLFLVLLLYSQFLFIILNKIIFFPLIIRILISFFILFIPGVIMGVFFPAGFREASQNNKNIVGFIWGANAFATVIGSILAVIISINFSFTISLIFSACIYLIVGFIFRKLKNDL